MTASSALRRPPNLLRDLGDMEARLGALERHIATGVEVVRESPLIAFNHGVLPDNSDTENAAALAALMALLPDEGGEIHFGRGPIRLSSFPSLDSRHSVVITGEGGKSGGLSEATELIYTGVGLASFISARSSFGVTFQQVAVQHESPLFTGILIDGSALPATLDTQSLTLRDVTMESASTFRTATGLNLNRSIKGLFDGCIWRNLDIGVVGRNTLVDYSTTHRFNGCFWEYIESAPVKNIGECWGFYSPVFQQLVSGAAGAIFRDSGFFSHGGCIMGGWFADTTTALGTWIDWAGNGFFIQAEFDICSVAIKAGSDVSSRGLVVSACRFPMTGIPVQIGANLWHSRVDANQYQGTTAPTFDNYVTNQYNWIMGPEGLMTPIDWTDQVPMAAPPANVSRLGTRLNGANQELIWKGDNNVLKTIATE